MKLSIVPGCLILLLGLGCGLSTDFPSSEPQTQDSQKPSGQPADSLPMKFTAVDTSRVMHSPEPMPLEKVRAFPNLKFQRPVELTSADDGTNRLFLVEQQGTIRVFENRSDVTESQLFLDLREVTLREGNEEGLLGLAFHPKFRENGQFFVYYSTKPRSSVVSRFTVSKDDPNRADRNSEKVLMRIPQPYSNHNGGSLRFGPDGFLYIGLGDGGLADDPHANGQNLETLLGSILRIDVDREENGRPYAIPEDNPFVDRPRARGEIWAYGLRNVWRLSFDRETGELYAGDVGQNRFEEVNLIQRGGNYGWNIREGFHDFDPNTPARTIDLVEPLAEYFRDEGQSVTGGMAYRGKQLEDFRGAYFYADYLSGVVWCLRQEEGQTKEVRRVAETGLEVAAFGEDSAGEMYLCAFDGHIYQLRPKDIDLEASKRFPRLLSETGFFKSVKDNIPAEGLIPYELNMPFWSDYAVKDRYIALPEKQSVVFHEKDKWEFPVGTVFVKTFWMHQDRQTLSDPLRLETRLLVHSPEGWKGYTYIYNDDQTEAVLLEGSLLKPIAVKTEKGTISQPYYFPSRLDCLACHTKAEGFVLGLTTRQMNHTLHYHGETPNQIEYLSKLDVFTQPVKESPENLEEFPNWRFGNFDRSGEGNHTESTLKMPDADVSALARAWLEVNCANCHRPEGIAPGGRDLRWDTPMEKMNLIRQEPLQGQMTPPTGTVLTPGEPALSELLIRAAHRGVRQMPPLASKVVDPRGTEVLKRWIETLETSE